MAEVVDCVAAAASGDEFAAAWAACTRECSRRVFGASKAVQPRWTLEGRFSLCASCARSCVPEGLAEEVRGGALVAFACEMGDVARSGFGTAPEASERLNLTAGDAAASREGAFRGAVAAQVVGDDAGGRVRQILKGAIATRRAHEDPAALADALSVVPLDRIRRGAAARLRVAERRRKEWVAGDDADAEEEPLTTDEDLALVCSVDGSSYPRDVVAEELLKWFKRDLFTWFKKPGCCSACRMTKKANFTAAGIVEPSEAERAEGWASRVELYTCALCGGATRFARLNNPRALLKSRTGRCGEFANCFTLLARAVGFEARYVLDTTDHVWTELWSAEQDRWLHADPCEMQLDKPRLYERGWGKKLVGVFAVDRCEVADVARRYARRAFDATLDRRFAAFGCSERAVAEEVARAHADQYAWRSTKNDEKDAWTANLGARQAREARELASSTAWVAYEEEAAGDASELQGRSTGDAAWIAARGEDGPSSSKTKSMSPPAGSWGRSARNVRVVVVLAPPPPPPSSPDDGDAADTGNTTVRAELCDCAGDWVEAATSFVAGEEFENINGAFRRSKVGDVARATLAAAARALADAGRLPPDQEPCEDPATATVRRRRHVTLLNNLLAHPAETKYRTLRRSNAVVAAQVLFAPAAEDWVRATLAFHPTADDSSGDILTTALDDPLTFQAALDALLGAWPAE